MNQFKFFENKRDRVFTQWMDEMDDYHLGGIRHARETPAQQLKTFHLNVMDNSNILGRIPSYNILFEPNSPVPHTSEVRYGTVEHLINGGFNIPWRFIELTIRRGGETQDTFTSYTIITHNTVDDINQRGLIFDLQDRIIIRSKSNY